MEKEIEFYRKLVRRAHEFITNYYSEPDITIICCLLDAYSHSLNAAYM